MFGNLLNNSLIKGLVDSKDILFTPEFDPTKLQIAQYPLHPSAIFTPQGSGPLKRVHVFKDDGPKYTLAPNAYVVVEILEIILLPENIVGRFISASSLIERGMSLVSGKIEYPFCRKGERIRFGVKNLLDAANQINGDEQLAYIEFFDLRGLDNNEYTLTQRDRAVYQKRIYKDITAPNYERDNR